MSLCNINLVDVANIRKGMGSTVQQYSGRENSFFHKKNIFYFLHSVEKINFKDKIWETIFFGASLVFVK